MKRLCSILAFCALTGCSTIHQVAESSGAGTNEVRRTELRIRSLGDSKQVVERVRASNGKTHSLGAVGVEQETTSQALETFLQALMQAAAKSAKP